MFYSMCMCLPSCCPSQELRRGVIKNCCHEQRCWTWRLPFLYQTLGWSRPWNRRRWKKGDDGKASWLPFWFLVKKKQGVHQTTNGASSPSLGWEVYIYKRWTWQHLLLPLNYICKTHIILGTWASTSLLLMEEEQGGDVRCQSYVGKAKAVNYFGCRTPSLASLGSAGPAITSQTLSPQLLIDNVP